MPLFKIFFTYLVIAKLLEETLTHDLKETSLSVYLPIPMKPAIIISYIFCLKIILEEAKEIYV